jgi:hypothetical protein
VERRFDPELADRDSAVLVAELQQLTARQGARRPVCELVQVQTGVREPDPTTVL